MPKNIKLKGTDGAILPPLLMDGDLDALRTTITEFLESKGTPDLALDPHPLFGEIGHEGWGIIHGIHFEHHLKQFGL